MYALVKFGQMRRAAGPAGDADMLAWAAAVVSNGGTVSTARKTVVETLITGLKADSVWSKLDRLWLLAAENSPSALTDLRARILATTVSSPTFTADKGFQSASGGRIDTGFIPNAGGNIFALDSGHISVWQVDHAVSTSGGILGSRNDAGTSYIEIDYAGNATDIVPRVNNVGSPVSGLTGVTGFMHANRSASNAFQFYQNGASIGSNTDVSVSPVSDNSITIGGLNGGGGFFATNDGQFAIMSVGGSLSSTDASNLFARIRDYLLGIATISVTDSDTISWITSVLNSGGYVTNTRALAVQTLVTGLKSDGIWTKLDRLWLFAGENPLSALTDLKAQALATVVNSPIFSTDLGYRFNGSSQYLNSQFTPSTAGGNYVQNSASVSAWVLVESTGSTDYIGGVNIAGTTFTEVRADGPVFMNSSGNFNMSPASGIGLVTATRTASGQNDAYRNGSSVGTGVQNSNGTLDAPLYFAARNLGGPGLYASCELSVGIIGGGLTSTEASNLYSRLNTFMQAIGAITDDADVNFWVSKVRKNGGTVSNSRRTHIYNLITGLKSDGVWSKLDRLWLHAAENAGSALTDLVAGALATNVGSASFTTDRGYSGFAATTYLDSNFNPATAGGNYVQNSATLASWVETTPDSTDYPNSIGITGATAVAGIECHLGSWYCRVNDTTVLTDTTSFSTGFIHATRTGANAVALYTNGASSASNAAASTGVDSFKFAIGERNESGGPYLGQEFKNGRIAATVIAGGLTATEAGDLYDRLRTYMTAVGVP